ncbi:MAG TPA: glutathione binding-like protein [Qipengyuania sp.]|nr:glutathione binding-like protein [Qipengyuania sp.]
MADYTFFFNPMSRAQIARWALHEVGADYEPVFVDWANKPKALLEANAMGKLPTIVHHHGGHDHVVSVAAAVCHYLAEREAPGLLPRDEEKADYFRWLFFAAGPVEQATTAHALGWTPNEQQQGMAGFGSYERTMDALDGWLSSHDYVCGERFTMADVYVGSQVDWGLAFKSMPDRPSFTAYAERLRARPAYQAAKAIDNALIAEMQK